MKFFLSFILFGLVFLTSATAFSMQEVEDFVDDFDDFPMNVHPSVALDGFFPDKYGLGGSSYDFPFRSDDCDGDQDFSRMDVELEVARDSLIMSNKKVFRVARDVIKRHGSGEIVMSQSLLEKYFYDVRRIRCTKGFSGCGLEQWMVNLCGGNAAISYVRAVVISVLRQHQIFGGYDCLTDAKEGAIRVLMKIFDCGEEEISLFLILY